MIAYKPVRGLTLMLLVAMLLVVPACSQASSAAESTSTPIPTPLVPVKPTYAVNRGDIVSTLQFTGRIAAVNEETLIFRVDGRIRTIYAKVGDKVKKGQVLADLENLTKLEMQQSLSKLAIRRAEIRLEMARLVLQQTEKSAWTVNQKTYDVPQKKYDVELAQIALDEVNLSNEDLETNIADAQIISPIDGELLSSTLIAGNNASAYKEAMVVADTSELEIRADLDSAMQARVEKDLPATITLLNRPDVEAKGKVRRLPDYSDLSASAQNKTQDISTRISMDTSPASLGLVVGDRVSVSLLLQSRQNVLWLAPQAIRTFEGRKFVIVQEGSVQRRLDIKVGVASDDRVEILEGLAEGQIIAAP